MIGLCCAVLGRLLHHQTSILFLQIDDLTEKLETASSKCLHLGKRNQLLQQELLLMKTLQKKCGKLEKSKRKLEQEVASLRSHIEENMVEHSRVQQYAREVEDRARQDLVEKLKQVNLFLQVSSCSWCAVVLMLQAMPRVCTQRVSARVLEEDTCLPLEFRGEEGTDYCCPVFFAVITQWAFHERLI